MSAHPQPARRGPPSLLFAPALAFVVLAALEWLRTAAALISLRLSLGQPYLRLALILGAVALLTAACLLLFRTERVRRYFRLDASNPT